MIELTDDKYNPTAGKVWPTVEEVLAKDTWFEDDITVLVAHQDELDAATLAKLGITRTEDAPVVEAPAKKKKDAE